MNNIPKSELWVGIRTVSESFGIARQRVTMAIRRRQLLAVKYDRGPIGGTGGYLMRLSDVEAWLRQHQPGLLRGRPEKSWLLANLIRQGKSVNAICRGLGMKRGAVLRFWQRECRRDPDFPRRDHRTDKREVTHEH